MTEVDKRKHRCCFTGHRPEKLSEPEWIIKRKLEKKIRKAISDGFTVFISGMARGVDIWAAEIVLKLQKQGYSVKLICASPYEGVEQNWSPEWKKRYEVIIEHADLVRYICPKYSPSCFQVRNEWMINHSAKVIAVYNGESGGTRNTINYAQIQSIPVEIIDVRI